MTITATSAAPAEHGTNWRVVWVTFGAGIVAAMHVGKLPPALTEIRTELGAGLVLAGWIASMIAAMGFGLGLTAGAISDWAGPRRVLVGGLGLLAAGSLVGSAAVTPELMLFSRFVEGVGFAACTVSGGVIVARAASDRDRRKALGIWSSYMPVGFSAMLMISALSLDGPGWRALWLAIAAVSVVWALAVLRVLDGWAPGRGRALSPGPVARSLGLALRQAGGVMVAICFALYTTQHLGMMNWLPTYMTEVYGAGAVLGAAVPAAVLLCNAGGNLTSAYAMGRGVPIWALLATGAAGMALAEAVFFTEAAPAALRMAFLLVFGVMGGIIPAACLASAPLYAPTAALVGAMGGLMVMGSNAGQLFGPPLLAAARKTYGTWEATLWVFLALAALGVTIALLTRAVEARAHAPR